MSVFGHCLAAADTKPDAYHSLCRRIYVDQWGIEHRCGCPNHDNDSREN